MTKKQIQNLIFAAVIFTTIFMIGLIFLGPMQGWPKLAVIVAGIITFGLAIIVASLPIPRRGN